MTKKHFIALADRIKATQMRYGLPWRDEHLAILADFCQSQNPRFDRQRWLDYINSRNAGRTEESAKA